MNNIKEEQIEDGSMGEAAPKTVSGTVDVNNKVENAALQDENKALKNDIAFLKNANQNLINCGNREIHRLNTILHARDATITAANKSIAGKQKQLDSLYATLQRQEKQIKAQVASIATLEQKHAAKLKKIRLRMNAMVRENTKRFQRHYAENVSQIGIWADDVKNLIKYETESERGSDYEEDEDEDEDEDHDEQTQDANGGEMVVIEINDDEEAAGTKQSTSNEQSAVNEQSDVAQQSVSDQQSGAGEQLNTTQKPLVTEQPSVTEQPATSEEHPNKRVKLTKEASAE